jgi:dienelactone hydrolase
MNNIKRASGKSLNLLYRSIVNNIFIRFEQNLKLNGLIIVLTFISFLEIKAVTVPSDSGMFSFVGNQTIILIDSSRNNRNIQSLVYYPSFSEGNGTPINLSGGKYPVISFGHGFTINPNVYIHLFRHLASWGYIVVAPSTETGFSPSHLEFARDLAFVLRDMKRKSRLPADFFFNAVDTMQTGIFGHSVGGGCSFLAGSLDSSVKAISSLAAAITNPSSINAIQQIHRPVQLLSGQRDSIASYWSHQLPHYNAANPFKQIINVKGGNHSYFHLLPALDDLVDNSATITRNEQQRLTRRYITAFFNLFLKNDTAYKSYLYGNIAQSDTSVIIQYQLPLTTGLRQIEAIPGEFKLEHNYPNPFNPLTNIEFSVINSDLARIEIFDFAGRKVAEPFSNFVNPGKYRLVFDASGLSSGVYFYSLSSGNSREVKKLTVLK